MQELCKSCTGVAQEQKELGKPQDDTSIAQEQKEFGKQLQNRNERMKQVLRKSCARTGLRKDSTRTQ